MDETSEVDVGNLIRAAREAKRLTRREVGEAINVSDQYIYRLETGRQKASLELLWRIAGYLELDPQSLDHRLAPKTD